MLKRSFLPEKNTPGSGEMEVSGERFEPPT
jgi:hypothetical protein